MKDEKKFNNTLRTYVFNKRRFISKKLSNQTLLHDMAYEMYEAMLNNDNKELELLLTNNLMTLEVSSNLIDVLLLLKTSSKSTLEEVKKQFYKN